MVVRRALPEEGYGFLVCKPWGAHLYSPTNGGSMKVTVLMTLYNKGPWVEDAVKSVLAQTYADFELLVVDDASSDDGLDRVRAIADPRIRILESSVNTGRANAANRGYDAAIGEYVAVLDADDLMHPERLGKQVAFLDAHPDIGAVGSWISLVHDPLGIVKMPANDKACRGIMFFGMPVLYPTCMLRRGVLEGHGIRCPTDWRTPGMDRLFLLWVGQHTKYANLQEALSSYRMGANNMRHGRNKLPDQLTLERAIAKLFNIPMDEAELHLHVAFHGVLSGAFDSARVKALWNWKKKLERMNRSKNWFTPQLFEAELDKRWKHVFYLLCDQDPGAGLRHLQISGSWPCARINYLTRVTLRRWAGMPVPGHSTLYETSA